MRVLVVLPTYNEAENILDVLDKVRAAVPTADVLVVDDGSPDGTADLADGWGRVNGQVDVLRRAAKSGLGSAYREGFRIGLERGYEVFVQMDSDLSHDPAALPSLLARLDAGADLVIGSRYVAGGSIPNWSTRRLLLSRWGNRYVSLMLRLDVRDATAGYRAFTADLMRRIDLDAIRADGYGFQIEMAYTVSSLGAQIAEAPIAFTDRIRGTSKMSGNIIIEALLLVTWWAIRDRIFRRRPPAARG